jgi:hypothetical protein
MRERRRRYDVVFTPHDPWVAVLPYYNVFMMGLKGLEAENRVGLEAWMRCGGIRRGCMAPG